ncbi:uncharacterized protein LTR77_002215 [Saxophila tyrrhenica]|uniref:Uncharacterized protein n=1 Tax=Saxophila tyrrhenica TaxID=1690608 RepID=A0AAV9PHY6_9PEZI|nr:hypothetical protein LTR77_002215 [Saxophila tyrrhenica]
MPAATRSATKQVKLEDVGAGDASASKSAGQKRKADSQGQKVEEKKPKRSKTASAEDVNEDDDIIIINRAPVLELWAACVAQTVYPSLAWETCLGPDPGEAQEKKENRKETAEKEDIDEVEVMSFRLNLDKNKQAMVGGKPKKASEETLGKKYGGSEQYNRAKSAFEEALAAWKGREDELDKQAFGFYEDFRPSIPPGQKGWGRKGQLRLQTAKDVVRG